MKRIFNAACDLGTVALILWIALVAAGAQRMLKSGCARSLSEAVARAVALPIIGSEAHR